MTAGALVGIEPLFIGYVLVFGAAAFACFASVGRARGIEDPDTRRGLVWLLLTSGGWATAHLVFLLVPTPAAKIVFYVAGLVIGFAAVGPWLYFCSAYTGRSLHRNRTIRRIAVALFLVVVLVKVTNPVHDLYFTTELVTTPFTHLAVRNGLFHWLAMGLAYALATVGYFMLLELFLQVSYDTRPFVLLVSVTGLPIVLDVVGFASPALVDITYEPLGVAVFAVGVLYVYVDRFRAIQLAGGRDDPVIVLDAADRIRDLNESATEFFPELRGPDVIGTPVETAAPVIAEALRAGTSILELDREGTTRYYRLTENPFGTDRTRLGRLLVLTDVTHREQYRRELERQNERLDQFANVVSHDLRNPLNVAMGQLRLARDDHDSEHLEVADRALTRMESLIGDLLALARQGQPIDGTERVTLSTLADRCGRMVDMETTELVVEGDLTFLADPNRVQQLLENLFRNSVEHGGTEVTITVGPTEDATGFYVEDDGVGIPEGDRSQVFESGYSTTRDGTGFGLAIVEEIADAHGWSVRVTERPDGGTRFEITDVEVVPGP